MAMTVTEVTPTNLPINGNLTIRVKGTNLDKVTGVSFNGVTIGGFTKVNQYQLEFPSPEFQDVNDTTGNLVLTSDTQPTLTTPVSFKVFDYAKTPQYKGWVNGWMSGHVDTTATSSKAPWIQQEELMELRDKNGDEPDAPFPVKAPEYDTPGSAATGFGF